MKKQTKKLVLAKETVRNLETSALRTVVVGGHATLDECNPDTRWSCQVWCVDATSGC